MSMLPKDCRECKEKASGSQKQSQLDSHFQPTLVKEIVTPYSDNLFCNATIEWLINTDQVHFINLDRSCYMTVLQPISALKHSSFQKMVNIASCTTTGVKIPN